MDSKADIFEVAKLAGVSKSTVSRVLNNSYGVSEAAKEKVMAAVAQLKYRPNMSARYLRNHSDNLLGILIPQELADIGITHMVNSKKIAGIVKKVKEMNYDVLIFIEDIKDQFRLHQIIREKGLKGVILLDVVPVEVLESFRNYHIPYVQVNWLAPGYDHQCYVKTDLAKATILALDCLIGKGYSDIGVINWEDEFTKDKKIENTYIEYMKKRNLSYDSVWNADFYADFNQVAEFMERSKNRAYISFSYLVSMKIIEYCNKKQLSIPGDIALLSYDYFPFYDYLNPKLSGIMQQAELMGEKAAEKLIMMIDGDKSVKSELVEPIIVMRDSC